MAQIHGYCDDRFESVKARFAEHFDLGSDLGASFALTLHGEPVVDIWGGFIDLEKTMPWQRNTITNVWSSTKTVAALCALVLADRGELDLYRKVSYYWPEFGQNGKDGIEIRHFLSHTSGLAGFDKPMKPSDLYDWDLVTAALAGQEPWWEPGSASGYHAITQGYLIGEVVKRVTGRSIGTFLDEEIATPLMADFFIGIPDSELIRCADVVPPPLLSTKFGAKSIAGRVFSNPIINAKQSHEKEWKSGEIPAANGQGNARSLAALMTFLANGGEVGNSRLLKSETCEKIFDVQSHGTDLVLNLPLRFGMGFAISGDETPISPNARTCFWGGWGGSLVVVDMEENMCLAYVMNKMGDDVMGDLRGVSLVLESYASLAESKK